MHPDKNGSMPRALRIQFEGAAYHVMSRGNHGQSVFRNRRDREVFLETLDEACARTGWEINAYVLMGNHYHLMVITPRANLVDGMKWLQGTFTQRWNARHRQRGHLFQGRYKAQNIQEGSDDYYRKVANYIHLNPARAGITGRKRDQKLVRLATYRWSSFPFFLQSRAKRPKWLRVDGVLTEHDLKDSPRGRRAYGDYLEDVALHLKDPSAAGEETGVWKQIRRGWYLGSDAFREHLATLAGESLEGVRRESVSGGLVEQSEEQRAERLIRRIMNGIGLSENDLATLRKSDPRKQAVAWRVRTATTVGNRWLSERLQMGAPSAVSNAVAAFRAGGGAELKRLRKTVERF